MKLLSASKKILTLIGLLVFLSLGSSSTADAQVVVKVRPNRPAVVVTKPTKARAGYIWVDGHWRHNGKRYVWVKGGWVKARANHNWVAGRWVACTGGHKWVVGYWIPVAATQRTVVVVNTPQKRVCRAKVVRVRRR